MSDDKNEFEKACEYIMDGDQWACRRPDFVNLQESLCGFGYTQIEAMEDLLRQESMGYKNEDGN